MHRLSRTFIGFLILAAVPTCLFADIRLPKIFSDKMVLQRDAPVRVWGWANPGEELVITLGEFEATATANENGEWKTNVAAPPVGGPYQLSIAGAEAQVVLSDVMVGEVWICGGESNMQWPLSKAVAFESDEEREKFLVQHIQPNFRLYTVPASAQKEPTSDFADPVKWEECTPDTIRDFSAVAFFFALRLKQDEKFADMPIGLIHASWGGTPAEAWTSNESLSACESLKPLLEYWKENEDNQNPSRPSIIYNGMIQPLTSISIRGVIWYQGETNVGRGTQYRTLLPTLIQDWRTNFAQGDFPFYFVQLTPRRYKNHDHRALPEVWDAQRETLKLPNTAMAMTSDLGVSKSINPMNKKEVGNRLGEIALSQSYGRTEIEWSGPTLESFSGTEDGKILVQFAHSEGLTSTNETIGGFMICGEDQEFKPAKAKIVDGKVEVWLEEIKHPVAVRFLWDDSSIVELFNGAGLPAQPFRTDEFELLSAKADF